MWMNDRDFFGMLAIVAVIGWAIISGGIWVFSHLHWAWG